MKVLAYGRRTRGASTAEQVALAEAWARGAGHEVIRLAAHALEGRLPEYPPRDEVLEACRRRVVDGVAVVALERLGPDLGATLAELETSGATLFVVGDEARASWELRTPELRFAAEVATAASAGRRLRSVVPSRICPPRVQVDPEAVRARQAAGARLADVAAELGVSRSTIVRRLGRERGAPR